ncbi:hypothetical protein [Sorangium sp. So ce542]|uniref:hypothetical protein n=1 Tax=Sorangium sp. So ce542 TaxID=3133316 RepID=UPI003F6101C3
MNDMSTSSATGYLTVTDLINKMKGKSLTNGWDVACAYGIDRLNEVLLSLYNQAGSKLVKTISLGSQENPYSRTYTIVNAPGVFNGLSLSITENYTFGLAEPALQFLSTTNTAALNMPIRSAQVVTTDATLKLLSPQPGNASELLKPNVWYKLSDGNFVPATVEEVDKAINTTGDPNQDPAFDAAAKHFYVRAEDPALDDQTAYQNKVYQLVHIQTESPKSPLDGDPDTYVLQAIVPIAAVTGDGQVISGDDVVVFGATGQQANVVLHFNTGAGSGSTFGLYKGGVKASPSLLDEAPDILSRIQSYFAQVVGDVDYVLTTVKSNPAGQQGIQLTPRSFRFATQAAGDEGTLTIFIQTHESGLDQGGVNLTFQDESNQPFLPVSSQANATLIYSRPFMARYYLVQGLQRNGFSSVVNEGTDDLPISVMGDYDSSATISVDGIHASGYDSVKVDPVTIGQMPMTMRFDSGSNFNVQAAISRRTKIHLEWTVVAPCYAEEKHKDVDAAIDVSASKTTPLQWTESGDELSFSFAIERNDYTVSVDSEISDSCGSSTRKHVDDQIEAQVSKAVPAFSVPMTALSAFAEENLLFGGKRVFALDTRLGVFSPQDVVLFGNI